MVKATASTRKCPDRKTPRQSGAKRLRVVRTTRIAAAGEQTQRIDRSSESSSMIQWNQLPGMRHGEYCDAHGHRLVVEAARWHPPAFGNHRVEEYYGFIGGVRVGTWPDLE